MNVANAMQNAHTLTHGSQAPRRATGPLCAPLVAQVGPMHHFRPSPSEALVVGPQNNGPPGWLVCGCYAIQWGKEINHRMLFGRGKKVASLAMVEIKTLAKLE